MRQLKEDFKIQHWSRFWR